MEEESWNVLFSTILSWICSCFNGRSLEYHESPALSSMSWQHHLLLSLNTSTWTCKDHIPKHQKRPMKYSADTTESHRDCWCLHSLRHCFFSNFSCSFFLILLSLGTTTSVTTPFLSTLFTTTVAGRHQLFFILVLDVPQDLSSVISQMFLYTIAATLLCCSSYILHYIIEEKGKFRFLAVL